MKKIYIASFLVTLAIGGAYFFPRPVHQSITAGAVGDLNGTPRIQQVSIDLSTTTPTTPTSLATSTMYNSDGRDRIVTSIELYATNIGSSTSNGSGVAAFTVKISTSTDIYTAASANYLYNATFSTSTPILYVSSSTPGVTGVAATNDFARVWKAGTYLNMFINSTSTGATGTGETGFLTVHYRTAP